MSIVFDDPESHGHLSPDERLFLEVLEMRAFSDGWTGAVSHNEESLAVHVGLEAKELKRTLEIVHTAEGVNLRHASSDEQHSAAEEAPSGVLRFGRLDSITHAEHSPREL